MKLDNRIFIVIIATIALYFIFLVISDLSEVYDHLNEMDLSYLPIILLLIPLSWMSIFTRWNLLLKNSIISGTCENDSSHSIQVFVAKRC